jgi:hypothetical protein
MERTLGGFISGAVEFIVSGVLLLSAGIFVLSAWDQPRHAIGCSLGVLDTSSGCDTALPIESLGGLTIGVLGLAFAYAFGVLAESVSRFLFEGRLDYVTCTTEALAPRPDSGMPASDDPAEPTARPRGRAQRKALVDERREAYVNERELRRLTVLQHPQLYLEIESQLRRLRLERVLLLMAGFVAFGFAARLVNRIADDDHGLQGWAGAAAGLVGSLILVAILAVVVRQRCSRYVNRIVVLYEVAATGDATENRQIVVVRLEGRESGEAGSTQ